MRIKRNSDIDVLEVDTFDSGTDDGTNFTSGNADTSPADNIQEITSAPLGDGSNVSPTLVLIKFEKLSSS